MDEVRLTLWQRLEQAADPDTRVEEAALRNIEAERVRLLLRQLPQLERSVLAWRFGFGSIELSHRAIASRLGVSVGTAWNIEQRALAMLRRRWRPPPMAA